MDAVFETTVETHDAEGRPFLNSAGEPIGPPPQITRLRFVEGK